MTAARALLISGLSAGVVVTVARLFAVNSVVVMSALAPGGIICLWTWGVHGEWGIAGEIVMVGVSFLFWFVVILLTIAAVTAFRMKRTPRSVTLPAVQKPRD